ncbi:TMEM175 family protein [Leifsonia poae]|uniref:TMEM175 family protein n=1 Tax=Leifsonia poae TaxID=110933 RepID=UPI003D680943
MEVRLPGTGRVEAFSDGVFAIAITLLILEIHVPSDTAHLLDELLQLWPSYLAYVVTFLLIGLVWANHHVMFDYIERSDRLLLFVNTLLLMNVASLPFVAAVLASALRNGEGENVAVALYGGTLTVGGVFFNAVWLHATRGHRLLSDAITPAEAEAKALARRFLAGPVLYLAGTVIGIFLPIGGIVVFAFLILFYWLPPQRVRVRTGG